MSGELGGTEPGASETPPPPFRREKKKWKPPHILLEQEKNRTLLGVLFAMVGLVVTVDLKNGLSIKGTIAEVQSGTSLFLSDAVSLEREPRKFDLVFILGSNVRFIDFPPGVDVQKLLFFREQHDALLEQKHLRPSYKRSKADPTRQERREKLKALEIAKPDPKPKPEIAGRQGK